MPRDLPISLRWLIEQNRLNRERLGSEDRFRQEFDFSRGCRATNVWQNVKKVSYGIDVSAPAGSDPIVCLLKPQDEMIDLCSRQYAWNDCKAHACIYLSDLLV